MLEFLKQMVVYRGQPDRGRQELVARFLMEKQAEMASVLYRYDVAACGSLCTCLTHPHAYQLCNLGQQRFGRRREDA